MGDKKEILQKEIELIQSCISRVSQNSFIIKGWTITLLTAILALLPGKLDRLLLFFMGFVIIICFWYLDASFLKIERLYRQKYEWVITNRLSSDLYCYDLDPHNEEMRICGKDGNCSKPQNALCIMFSKTLRSIYVPLLVLTILFLFWGGK